MKLIWLVIYSSLVVSLYAGTDNDLYITKMDIFLSMDDYKKAHAQMEKIDLTLLSKDQKAGMFNKCGFIYYHLGRFAQARKNYEKALLLNPDLAHVYNNLGVLYFKIGEYEKAKAFYLRALLKKAEYPRVMINLVIVNLYLKKFFESLKWLKKALECNENYVKKRYNREKAMNQLSELIRKNPDDKELETLLEWVKNSSDKDFTKAQNLY
ncbi:MAG: tetratricopeptide repeat protein [Spirochaetes bacterium]|nr:tetratricopeptide repeat protein [Spirochaetota bacterium]